MWKPPTRLLGDALVEEKKEPTNSDYYKITQYILDNLEMHEDYEPPIQMTQTCLERLKVTYRVNIWTVDRKKKKKLWKSYWVEIKGSEMKFNPPLEIRNA